MGARATRARERGRGRERRRRLHGRGGGVKKKKKKKQQQKSALLGPWLLRTKVKNVGGYDPIQQISEKCGNTSTVPVDFKR